MVDTQRIHNVWLHKEDFCAECWDRLLNSLDIDEDIRDRAFAIGAWDAPTIEVAPVVHGRWVHLGGDEWCCSACGFVISTEGSWEKPTQKYCEDCGAKMEGESI